MKIIFRTTMLIICVIFLGACGEESVVPNEIPGAPADVSGTTPECTYHSVGGDWDGTRILLGGLGVIRIGGQNANPNWFVSNDVISIVSGANSNAVTLKANKYGTCVLTFQNGVNGSPSCSSSGTIIVPRPPEPCKDVQDNTSIVIRNMVNGFVNNSVCPNRRFEANMFFGSNWTGKRAIVNWTVRPVIIGLPGPSPITRYNNRSHIEYTDTSQYGRYVVTANYSSTDNTICGSKSVLVSESASACGGTPI
ncbi:MAG: hypothetical protein AAGA66_02905 [Bacteroidota bacterium]